MSVKEILHALEQLTPEECQQVRQALEQRLACEAARGNNEITFKQRLLAVGLLSEIKQALKTAPPGDRTPIHVTGKPLSQMIIEERR
jgi:hypothetical protein